MLTEEKDEECPSKLALPGKVQGELVHQIQTSVLNIGTQVNNLNKYAEEIFVEICNEVDKVSFRLRALQQHVVQLTDTVTHKDKKKESSLVATKSETCQSNETQMKQINLSQPSSVKIHETHDVSVQTVPLNMPIFFQNNTEGLMTFPDVPYCFETHKEMFISDGKEKRREKLKQKKKHLYHPYETESLPRNQLMRNVSAHPIQNDCREVSYSCVGQAADISPCSTCQSTELSKLLTRAVGKVLSSPLPLPKNGAGDLKNSLPHVSYGTGMGKEVQSQPRIRLKTQVFVSPTAPTSPPPLPSDWLTVLRTSETVSPASIIQPSTPFPSPALRAPEAKSLPDSLQNIPEFDFPITQPKMCLPLQYSPMSPSLASSRIETKEIAEDLIDCASVKESISSFIISSEKYSPALLPRFSTAKSPKSSTASAPKSSLQPPTRYVTTQLPKSAGVPLTRYSNLPPSQNAVPPPSFPQASKSSAPPPRNRCVQSPRILVAPSSRHSDSQSPKSSVVVSGRSSAEQSTGHLIPPQQRSSSLKSARPFTLQSLFSFAQSTPASTSNPQALSMPQSSQGPVTSGLKVSSSTSPIFSKARNVLMEAIRKGILLRKNEDQCVLKARVDISKNEEASILIHRKSIGYNFGKSEN